MLSHIVKRGVARLQAASPEYIAKLQQDAELYENAGPGMEVNPQEALPVLITGLIVLLILASIRYTLGDVVASLAMIESSSPAIVEPKLPAYTDEEPLIPADSEAGADIESTGTNVKPITARLSTTMRHLRSVGGFRARWRGLGISMLYHFAHTVLASILSRTLGVSLLGGVLVSIVSSVLLARVHMLWTHTMIAYPTTKSFLHRMVPLKECKPLLLPSLVFAAAQQATFLLPLAVAVLLDLPSMPEHALHAAQHDEPAKLALLALRILAVPATAATLALAVLLPASITLTRIEAALLPADAQPIVPFDRAALVGSIDLAARGGATALFAAAWRSVDRAVRLRLVKLYAKMVFAQLLLAVLGLQIMAAEVYVIGGERLAIFFTSARAQLELMAIGAPQN
ncbi:hypothetical protein DFH07DRAFT_950405 [Mycena maculata]|uniref:Uncharacterized protein n=1 Tax=Mycena maculata TaxID=230809 RepID=A0AAD7K8X9_9AGAR|nr:hypothetical protein DFH07DRAFT_950405 [Mycena maculata]